MACLWSRTHVTQERHNYLINHTKSGVDRMGKTRYVLLLKYVKGLGNLFIISLNKKQDALDLTTVRRSHNA